MQTELERYKEAVIHVICLLEPLYWKCPQHNCEGCEFEAEDALIACMNALAGLDNPSIAHYGDAVDRDGNVVVPAQYTTEQRYYAWRKAGFVQDGAMWRRGTAC